MKYLLWFLFIGNIAAYAQQTIKDLTVQDLKVVSTTKGSKPCPAMTQTQRNAIASPSNSDCVYNTTTSKLNTYNGSAWKQVSDTVVLTTDVTGILPIANGGTASSTRPFVDLSSSETIGGTKTFSSTIVGSVNGNAATVTTNANLSGDVASSGNTTSYNATVPVSKGGTGLATLTANNVILGNGSSTPSFVAPGTNGNVLTSNGTTWVSSAASGGSGVISAVGATGNNGNIKLAFGTSNTNSDCTGSPCLVTQIGTEVSSMTRSGTGSYTLNFARTYTTLICNFAGFNGGSNVQAFLGNNQIICSSCNSIAFTIEKSGSAADAHGVIDCNTNY